MRKSPSMTKLKNRLEIISRKTLLKEARTIVHKNGTGEQARKSLLGLYRREIERGSGEIERRFNICQDGALAVQGHCFLIDQLIRVIHDIGA